MYSYIHKNLKQQMDEMMQTILYKFSELYALDVKKTIDEHYEVFNKFIDWLTDDDMMAINYILELTYNNDPEFKKFKNNVPLKRIIYYCNEIIQKDN